MSQAPARTHANAPATEAFARLSAHVVASHQGREPSDLSCARCSHLYAAWMATAPVVMGTVR